MTETTSGSGSSDPVWPDYGGACLSNVVPALVGVSPWPEWMPGERPDNAVVVLLDGLGQRLLERHSQHAPTLEAMTGTTLTTVSPSTTAAALTSFTTGTSPGEHGVIGYRIATAQGVMNSLRWTIAGVDARDKVASDAIQKIPPFAGAAAAVVSPAAHGGSGFTLAHLRGADYVGYDSIDQIAGLVANQVDAGDPLVYVYYDGLDVTAHLSGLGRPFADELACCDALVAQVCAAIGDTALFVTADHGLIECGRPQPLASEVIEHIDHQSGEARFRWLHARKGRAQQLLAATVEHHGECAYVMTRDEVIERELLGPLSDSASERLGDVALVGRNDVCFADPNDATPADLVGRHGGLTADEMLVPLLRRRALRVGGSVTP